MNSPRLNSNPASNPKTGLVWLLTIVGLSTLAIVLAMSFWSLICIRADRVAGDALRAEVSEIASRADRIIGTFSSDSLHLLNDQTAIQRLKPEQMESPTIYLAANEPRLADQRITGIVQEIEKLVTEIQTLHDACVRQALQCDRLGRSRANSIEQTENSIHRLHAILQTTQGLRMLDIAKAFRAYRKLEGKPAQLAAQQFLTNWPPQAMSSTEVADLQDLMQLQLRMVSETNQDALIDIRDNQIRLRIDRLRRNLETDPTGTHAITSVQNNNIDTVQDKSSTNNSHATLDAPTYALQQLEESFFGSSVPTDRVSAPPQTETHKIDQVNGLYQNCVQWLTLASQCDSLKAKLADHAQKYANVKSKLLRRSSTVTSDSANRATELVAQASMSILVTGLISTIVFLFLARKVARTISSQFKKLSQQSVELAEATDLADKLSLVAKHTSNSVVITDSESKIEWVNDGFRRMTGYQADEVIGRVPGQFLQGPDTDEQTVTHMQKSLSESKGYDVELVNYRKDGSAYWVESEVRPIVDTDGNVMNFIRIESDMTQRKDSEREREVLANELQAAARQAGMAELATDVLHNVGNALNSINVSVQTLRDQIAMPTCDHLTKASQLILEHQQDLTHFFTSDQRGKQLPSFLRALASTFVSDRQAQLTEVGELIEKIEHVNEIVASQKTFSQRRAPREPISPQKVVQEAIKMNIASLVRHGVRLEEDYQSGPDVLLEKHAVVQVIINLIKNAKESVVAANSHENIISVSVKRLVNQVQFSVRDNGKGIARENLIEIFRHGFTTKATGQGFGLHSAANVAQEQGGTLSVKSDGEGKGATFTLTVPAMEIAPCVA
ncbi:two-component system sensor histidine kinase NtrB [Neorhodopirellula lusitana]|uniref:two-component system sensor histidine kinase NtrB n=1 Tax=Neorhodopirellula lusitana TaxID=445327 RepID=UPI00384F4ABE